MPDKFEPKAAILLCDSESKFFPVFGPFSLWAVNVLGVFSFLDDLMYCFSAYEDHVVFDSMLCVLGGFVIKFVL